MHILYAFIVGCSVILSTALAVAAEARNLEAMDAFDLEYADDARIAPDGDRIVYVRHFADVKTDARYSNLWIVDFDGSNHRPLTTGNVHDNTPRWSPDGDKLAYISDESGSPQIYVRWMDTGQTQRISNLTQAPGGISWSPDGATIAFTMLTPEAAPSYADMPRPPEGAEWKEGPFVTDDLVYRFNGAGYLKPGYHHIYVLPATGGTPRQISSGDYHHAGPSSRAGAITWTPDSDSVIISVNRNDRAEVEVLQTDVFRYDIEDGAVTQITDRFGPDDNARVSPDGRWVAYTGFDDERQGYQVDKLSIQRIGGNQEIRILTDGLDRSVHNLQWDADSDGLYFAYDDEGMTKLGYVDRDGDIETDLAQNLSAGFGMSAYGDRASFTVSENGRIAAIFTDDQRPNEVAAGNRRSGIQPLTNINADVLGQINLGAVEEIWYESSHDGRRIQGWIITPPDFDPDRTYPLIIEIHGGPFANYGPRFDFEKQLMAARGHVVLYVNPRGSTSYGQEFGNLIHHAYPGDDFYDLNAGVDAVIERGYIDTDRLYVTGGSGGGVLTAWMIGRTERFRAAVIHYPVVDWASFNLTSDIPGLVINYWFPGAPWDHVDHYFSRSLLSVVDNVTAPTMLITGEGDWRTPISQTEQYYAALKWRGIDAAMVRIPDEPHGMRVHPSHHIAKMLNTLGWFDKYD